MEKKVNNEINVEELPKLTNCESVVLKCIMESGDAITLAEIMLRLKTKYKKEWKQTTVCTFLLHLGEKGYIASYKKGRASYYYLIIDAREFKAQMAKEFKNFWFDGSIADMISATCRNRKLSCAKMEQLQELLQDMDS